MTTCIKEKVLLRAEHVCLTYNNKTVLRNVCFNIQDIVRPGMTQGQVVSLIGRSGIGKTQLFKLLSGLQKPTSGNIFINEAKQVEAGDMGVVFQNYYLFEWRTIYQSLLLSARQNKKLESNEKDAVEKLASEFELTEVLHSYPQNVSGGQRQRASIVQQLLKDLKFLLLDEPFSGLDVCVLDKVVKMLLQVSLSDELKTLIIVSHDIATSVAISDTVFIMGKDKDEPGATIKKEIDLVARDLAWQKDIKNKKVFVDTIYEIKASL